LNNRVSDLEKKVKTLFQPNITTHNSSDLDIINAILDRKFRTNNILLFNFPEKSPDSTFLKTDSDRLKIIFSKLDLKFEPIKLHRLDNKSNYERSHYQILNKHLMFFGICRTIPEFKDLRFSSDRNIYLNNVKLWLNYDKN